MLETAAPHQQPRTWSGFYQTHKSRAPHPTLIEALARFATPGTAVDLGYGSGNETLHLLEAGWNVVAIDRQAEAATLLEQRIPAQLRPALELRVAGFEDIELPRADLVFAGFSLPFCQPARWGALWNQIRNGLRSGGRFAGQLFGPDDDWATNPRMTFHSRAQLAELFEGFEVENLVEVRGPGRAFDGPKNWHVFHVIARRF